jgi:hypothetical protein
MYLFIYSFIFSLISFSFSFFISSIHPAIHSSVYVLIHSPNHSLNSWKWYRYHIRARCWQHGHQSTPNYKDKRFFPFLTLVPDHKGVWERRSIDPPICDLRIRWRLAWVVSFLPWLLYPPPGKIRQYSLGRGLGWFGILFDHSRKKNKFLASTWYNTLVFSRPVRRLFSLTAALAHMYRWKDFKWYSKGSHNRTAEDSRLLGYASYQLVELPTFRRNVVLIS